MYLFQVVGTRLRRSEIVGAIGVLLHHVTAIGMPGCSTSVSAIVQGVTIWSNVALVY